MIPNYLIVSMKRSGQHAVMNWIAAHTHQRIYNNVCFGWEDKKLLTMKGREEAEGGIANIEDFNPAYLKKYSFETFPYLQNCKLIVIMRSANNWLASCYKRKNHPDEEQRDVYKYLNKPYINDSKLESPSRFDLYTRHLYLTKDKRFVPIEFDSWFANEDHRKYYANQLGFEFNKMADASRKMVSKNGGGSSFDGMKYDIKANEMKVLKRSKEFDGQTEFEKLKKVLYKKTYPVLQALGFIKMFQCWEL